MKRKITLFTVAVILGLGTTSCGKHCWCYEHINGDMTEVEAFVDPGTPCKVLSTTKRTCVEDAERMDPDKIADPYYKR